MTPELPPDRPPCAIRAWFAAWDDGEFLLLPRAAPYWVLPPPADSSSLIYTTKPQIVWALLDAQPADVPCGVVGRAGLPHEDDASWHCGGGASFWATPTPSIC